MKSAEANAKFLEPIWIISLSHGRSFNLYNSMEPQDREPIDWNFNLASQMEY